MLLEDKFRFGKYGPKNPKGPWTLKEVLECEQGRDWLEWYVEQEPLNLDFKDFDRNSKKIIRKKLEQQMGKFSKNDVSSVMSLGGEVHKLRERIEMLEKEVFHKKSTMADDLGDLGESL